MVVIRRIAAAVILATASAAEVSALVYGTSCHFKSGRARASGYNGTNPGAALRGWRAETSDC